MKRILFLAPSSIPMNDPEAVCNAKLLKVLSENGYIIDLISKSNHSYIPETNVELFTKNIASLKIFNLANTINLKTIIDHFRAFLKTGYIYKGIHWAYYGIKYGEELIKKNRYDYILSRNPPSEVVALYLSKKYNIPWIANWNDPYPTIRTPIPYGKGPGAHLSFTQRILLKNICKYVRCQTFPHKRERDYMLQYMKTDINRTKIIPHVCIHNLVYDIKKEEEKPSKLKLVHSGNISAPRDPYPFLLGLKQFLLKNKNANIEINIIGKQSPDFVKIISDLSLDKYINILQPLGYIDNLLFIKQQDIAIIIEAPSENSVFLPTKVGDYMQCGKDIFAISPMNGVLNDLYNERAIKYFADCIDSDSIFLEIEKIYNTFLENNQKYESDTKIISEYSEKTILDLYEEILE